MAKLIMCKGLPGSGKSTWASSVERLSQMSSDDTSQWVVRVNKDDIRAIRGKDWSPELEQEVLMIRDSLITSHLRNGKDVISDDTNLAPKHEARLRQLAKKCGAQFEINDSFLKISLEECIVRDSKREGKAQVGPEVIQGMYNKYLKPKEAPVEARPYVRDKSLKQAIICDLDGTLALHNGRSPYDYQRCDTDLVNGPIKDILWKYFNSFSEIIYLSGRDGSARDKTQAWLEVNRCPPGKLYMRTAGDQRKDYIVKTELFDAYIRDKYDVLFCLDDRDQVVKLWRGMGLVCLQVNYGNF